MQAYIKARGLAAAASHPSRAVLDALLCDSLLKGRMQPGERYPTELPRVRAWVFLNPEPYALNPEITSP